MSQVKREMERLEALRNEATAIAAQAKAIKECKFPGHSECYVAQWDDDANNLAYAIGTNRWKAGAIDGAREELMDAIKKVIDDAPGKCPECERMNERD